MVRKLPLLAGSFLIAALTSFAASAGTFAPPASTQTSLVEKAQWGDPYYDRGYRYGYRRSCRFWRNECADLWGWGGWEYRRCLRRHGCGGDRYYDDQYGGDRYRYRRDRYDDNRY